jgi:hypothetical protein
MSPIGPTTPHPGPVPLSQPVNALTMMTESQYVQDENTREILAVAGGDAGFGGRNIGSSFIHRRGGCRPLGRYPGARGSRRYNDE